MADSKEKVAVIGSGNIGSSWALLFSSAGFHVSLHDNDPTQLSNVLDDLKGQLQMFASYGLSRGNLDPDEQMKNVTLADDLEACVTDASFIIECVPEDLQLKQQILRQADQLMTDDAILSSSTSSILPSVLSTDLVHRKQMLVIHPVNPPFCARAVELVPAPWTSADVMQRSRDVMARLGQAPVVMKKEIGGFVLNRMQMAIMGESWRLLKEGVVGVDGINKAVWSGLGPRYAFLGPFQVGHLNAAGFGSYLDRYGPLLLRLQQSMGPAGRMGGQLARDVQRELEAATPLSALPQRRVWRQVRMARLARLKRDLQQREAEEAREGMGKGKVVPITDDV